MKTILSFTLAVLLCISVSAQKNKKDLNGQTYTIKLTTPPGKASGWDWTTDEISFKKDVFRAKVIQEHEKFEDASSTVNSETTPAGQTLTFKAESKNPGGSKIKWSGKATGSNIEGTVVWTNMQGKRTYTFTGTLNAK